MNLEEAIQLERQLHPCGTRQDLYKLIVQSCLGNGHLITSPEDSFQALQKEKSIAGNTFFFLYRKSAMVLSVFLYRT